MYNVYKNYALLRFDFGVQIAKYIDENLMPLKRKKVLDIGVGTGGIASAFANFRANIIGIDISNGFLKIAKAQAEDRGVKLELLRSDCMSIPFKDEVFDVVLCVDVLEHVPSPDNLTLQMSRVLKKGGLMFVTADNKWSFLVFRGPHYGLPFNILLPRKIRELLVVKLTKRGHSLGDYHWFGGFREIKKLFEKYNIQMSSCNDLKNQRFDELLKRKTWIKKMKMEWFVKRLYNTKMICIGKK